MFHPEQFCAKAGGVTDDGPAFSAAYAAASATHTGSYGPTAILRCAPWKKYGIATSIIVQPLAKFDGLGASLIGPTTGAGYTSAGDNPAVPAGADVAGQTARACFIDTGGNATIDGLEFENAHPQSFRWGMVSACYSWNMPISRDVAFENCNVGSSPTREPRGAVLWYRVYRHRARHHLRRLGYLLYYGQSLQEQRQLLC